MQIKCQYDLTDKVIEGKQVIDLLLKSRKIEDPKEFLNPTSPLKISLSETPTSSSMPPD